MSTRAHYDAIVIGGGPDGLAAAAYLARERWRVLVLDVRDELSGPKSILLDEVSVPREPRLLQSFDAAVARELKLERYGLAPARGNIPLVALHPAGQHLVLGSDRSVAQRSIVKHSKADAEAWPRFQRDVSALARALRSLSSGLPSVRFPFNECERLDALARSGAVAWLDTYFESDFLKAGMCFDSMEGGLSPLELGSALNLLSRAAKTIGDPGSATFSPLGGYRKFVDALMAVARELGVEQQAGVRAGRILLKGARAVGVELEQHIVTGNHILSTLSAKQTARMLPRGALGIARTSAMQQSRPAFAEATVLLLVRTSPEVAAAPAAASRFVCASSLESLVRAHMAASSGELPEELPMEFMIPPATDPAFAVPDRHLISVLVRPVPVAPAQGWESLKHELLTHVLVGLERFIPRLRDDIIATSVLTPEDVSPNENSSCHWSSTGGKTQFETPISGLFLCGHNIAPIGAAAGSTGRMAARLLREARP